MRKGRLLLALRAVKHARALGGADDPTAHTMLVRLIKALTEVDQGDNAATAPPQGVYVVLYVCVVLCVVLCMCFVCVLHLCIPTCVFLPVYTRWIIRPYNMHIYTTCTPSPPIPTHHYTHTHRQWHGSTRPTHPHTHAIHHNPTTSNSATGHR